MAVYEEEGRELMDEILATGSVRNITVLIKACNFSPEAFILTENFPSYPVNDQQVRQNLLRFARIKDGLDKDGFDVNNTTSGRVFHKTFELRWEKRDHEYWAIYLGVKRNLPALKVDEDVLKKLQKHEESKHYYLFGEVLDSQRLSSMGLEGTTGYYAEVRIPRLLHYPPLPNAPQRVQLVICEYIDKTTGSVQLFRFQNLEPEPEEKQ